MPPHRVSLTSPFSFEMSHLCTSKDAARIASEIGQPNHQWSFSNLYLSASCLIFSSLQMFGRWFSLHVSCSLWPRRHLFTVNEHLPRGVSTHVCVCVHAFVRPTNHQQCAHLYMSGCEHAWSQVCFAHLLVVWFFFFFFFWRKKNEFVSESQTPAEALGTGNCPQWRPVAIWALQLLSLWLHSSFPIWRWDRSSG